MGWRNPNPGAHQWRRAVKLTKPDEESKLDTAEFPYSELVGSLLYISVCTRPDIAQSVGALARYMADPRVDHWLAAKGVLRYLGRTRCWNSLGSSEKGLQGYCDADYAGDLGH